MSSHLNRSSIASLISTIIITFATYYELPDGIANLIKMTAPLVSYIIIVIGVWVFLKSDFDTIEGMQESKARTKQRKQIEENIDALCAAIESGLLTPEDEAKKKAELSAKYSELTNITAKPK